MKSVDRWRKAIRHSDLKATARHVAIELSEFMDRDSLCNAHPGAPLLAKRTGLHPDTVKVTLKKLEARGWIECTRRGKGPGSASNWCGRFPSRGSAEPPVQGAENPPTLVHTTERPGPEGRASLKDDPRLLEAAGSIRARWDGEIHPRKTGRRDPDHLIGDLKKAADKNPKDVDQIIQVMLSWLEIEESK